ncbi:MAG: CD225/dispanin family protein [Bacteroidales bacterium]|jgi:TRAP-type C4-dicarboxylate transport system permease small subunit|nr:CD225/dispanin family protein [Bacteroidales bacterium]
MEASNTPKPDNYLALAIITTILCCLPFGIVAIVKASQVDTLYFAQQYEAAQKASSDAKKWSIIGLVTGGAGIFLYFIFILICALIGAAAN